jgi:Kef-type K+ transport system membrane component KefB
LSEDITQRLAQLAAKQARVSLEVEDEIAAAASASTNRNRDLIVACVIGAYTFAVVASVLYLIIAGAISHEPNTFQNIAELLKIGVVPIVTLVIGYYFASKGN